jgi:hypothetical protein
MSRWHGFSRLTHQPSISGASSTLSFPSPLADDRVERSPYQRACGYEVDVKKTVIKKEGRVVVTTTTECREHIPGDVTAQTRRLSIRRPKQWREELPDGAKPERSPAEIKEIILQKLMEWGLKVVPADAPLLESVKGGGLASPASQVSITKAPT